MICLSPMHEEHVAAMARWRAEQENPPLTARDHLTWLRELRAEMRAENATRERPDPVCKRCGVVHQREDGCEFFPGRCSTCGIQRLEKLVRKIIGRHGRRRTVRLLRRLAK